MTQSWRRAAPGTVLAYLAFNLRDPILKDERVRQALAYAIDRGPLLDYLSAIRPGPPTACCPRRAGLTTVMCVHYPHDPAKATPVLERRDIRAE